MKRASRWNHFQCRCPTGTIDDSTIITMTYSTEKEEREAGNGNGTAYGKGDYHQYENGDHCGGGNVVVKGLYRRRWFISFMGMYGCGLMYALRSGTSVAMVRMTDNSTAGNATAPVFDWSQTLQGEILGAIFYLYWILPTVVGSFTDRFGGKRLAMIGLCFPCILAALAPTAAVIHYGLLILVYTLVGVFQSFIYPAFFHLYVQWFPPEERSKANAGIQVGQAMGGAFMYLIGGVLCETHIGWPMVFYTVSLLHIPWILLWWFFGADRPPVTPSWLESTAAEKSGNRPPPKVPWMSILLSGPVWASTLSKFACSYGFYMLLSKLPAYLSQVYHMSIVDDGFVNAGTYFAYGVSSICAPFFADLMIRKTNIRPLMVRKLFQGVAMMVPAICLISITLCSKEQESMVIVLLIVAMLGYGFVTGGEWTMISDYAPNFVGTLAGFTSILGFTTGVLAPYFVGIILDSPIGSNEFKWNLSFYMASGFYVVCYLAFYFMCSDEQQEWDKIPK